MSEIELKTAKLAENKPFYKKIPWWGWVAFFLASMWFVNLFPSSERYRTNQRQEQKTSEEGTTQKVSSLRSDIVESLNDAGSNMFEKSYLERVTDNNFKITLTVKDSWYYLEKYQQERLLEDMWRYFNSLGAKYGLRKDDDMPWTVVFVDTYDKQVATKGW